MKKLFYILLCFPVIGFAQRVTVEQDTTAAEYYYIEGDSILKKIIDLDEVLILNKLNFKDRDERIKYLILKRKTIKVYPYAKLAADRLVALNERLESLDKKWKKKRYTKVIQRYIEEEFSAELKKLTRTEGQILVKLVHRQTGITTFDLVKELRSGWRAFWYNNTAKLFKISLKEEFNPIEVKEDFLIEDILERAFQARQLERQAPAVKFDYYELTEKWTGTKTKSN